MKTKRQPAAAAVSKTTDFERAIDRVESIVQALRRAGLIDEYEFARLVRIIEFMRHTESVTRPVTEVEVIEALGEAVYNGVASE